MRRSVVHFTPPYLTPHWWSPLQNPEPTYTDDLGTNALRDLPAPQREGLPQGFKMRADAHYVDALESSPRLSIRSLRVDAIEADSTRLIAAAELLESVRKHGVLEPLLVQQTRRGKHRLLSGYKRLAAARAAGLSEVPCVLYSLSDADAAAIASVPSTPDRAPVPTESAARIHPSTPTLERMIDDALTGITAATVLNTATSMAVRTGASEIVNVEAHRALRLLGAARVVKGDDPLHCAPIDLSVVLTKTAQSMEREERLLRSGHRFSVTVDQPTVVECSEDLLVTAAYAIVTALGMALPTSASRHVEMTAAIDRDTMVAGIEVCERGLSIPESWTRTAFEHAWPVPGGAAALALLQAARAIADRHEGSLTMHSRRRDTTVRLTLGQATPAAG